MFVNRTRELEVLEEEYAKKSSSFSVIYGRRRVGKTALISEFIKNNLYTPFLDLPPESFVVANIIKTPASFNTNIYKIKS